MWNSSTLETLYIAIKVFFKKMVNSLIKLWQTYSEILIFCVMKYKDFWEQSIEGTLKK